MKKLSFFWVVFILAIVANSFDAKAVEIIIRIQFGIYTTTGCVSGPGICSIYIGTNFASGQVRTTTGTDVEVIDGTAELKDGKLFVKVSKGINVKGKNARGAYEFAIKENGVKSPLVIDPAVVKELGVESLTVIPGNYSFNGNTIAFSVPKPRDTSSGLPTGKRQ
jgi:hypothetical protein